MDIMSMDVGEARRLFEQHGLPGYRGEQVLSWIHRHGIRDYSQMTNLPAYLRDELQGIAPLRPASVAAERRSVDGTIKLLLEYPDGNAVETVIMRHDYGVSVCVSSQVGCAMGCSFCASGIGGLVRNLTPGEMLEQVLEASIQCRSMGAPRISSIVVMGSGEPMHNYDNVVRFVRLANWNKGLGIGYRHITVSTCGIVPGIRRLAGEGIPITLSVSLHAPDDETRSRLMPVNRVYPVGELIAACRDYADVTGRRVTYEYALVRSVNDSPRHARKLVELIAGSLCHVNLIPVNPVEEAGFDRPDQATVQAFADVLSRAGISTTIRRELGTDIEAACGQLRRRVLGEERGRSR
ncbi:MAG: 23S rRNA (adenine(2503)-C(2))-methyltransferase RlmN [Firmicutes bacterium]|jgi:23S rRNA (adenine2503-C2)-methyltransferase|nr:23S rRNA (adenine(2503)-C(2))-methyltransferase RlmN [Bacillota bacterium]